MAITDSHSRSETTDRQGPGNPKGGPNKSGDEAEIPKVPCSELSITDIQATNDQITWDRYVLNHAVASGYHLTGWRRVVEQAFGHHTFYFMAKDADGDVRGVLPLVLLSSRLFGSPLVSMPFFNYGGVLADTEEAREALLLAAVNLARKLKASHIELRHQAPIQLEWPRKQHKVSMRLELPSDFETLWKRFPSKLRSQIRRAQKEEMRVVIGSREILSDFYQVFSRNMRDLGTPVYGRWVFDTILEAFPKEARICTVYWNNRPLASAFLYGFRKTLEIPWASSDRRFNHFAPNMLLYSAVLEFACQQGYRVFDFGRSTSGTGTERFKEQWGAKPLPLYWHYWVPNGGSLPDVNPQNPKYTAAIGIWKRLPLFLTRVLGPVIVKNIP